MNTKRTENQKAQARHNAFFSGNTKRGSAWLKAKRANKARWFKANPNPRTQTYGGG